MSQSHVNWSWMSSEFNLSGNYIFTYSDPICGVLLSRLEWKVGCCQSDVGCQSHMMTLMMMTTTAAQ